MAAAQASRTVEEDRQMLQEKSWREGVRATCPNCEAPLAKNAIFCTECGAKLTAGAKFCPECLTKVG